MKIGRRTPCMTRALLALLACAAARAAELQISTTEAEHTAPPPVAGARAFADGKMFYHAVPSTPAIGHSYKII